nr:hypothetical protein ABT39_MTgene1098 [Picea glauca]
MNPRIYLPSRIELHSLANDTYQLHDLYPNSLTALRTEVVDAAYILAWSEREALINVHP